MLELMWGKAMCKCKGIYGRHIYGRYELISNYLTDYES